MEELQLALTTARVDQRNFGLWINNWQVGQTLNALVSNQLPSGELVLRVDGRQITATSDIPIQQGTQLLLEVKQLNPTPTLRVLSPQATPLNSETVGGTLRLLTGVGAGVSSSSLAGVMQAAQEAPSRLALPPVVADSLAQLLRLSTRASTVARADGLAAAVRGSGIFLEPELAAAPQRSPVPGGDLKAGLFRALARTDAALAQAQALSLPGADAEALLLLKQELEGGLGRIITQQLASHPAEGQAGRSWYLDIPVQLGAQFHNLQLAIEEELPERGDGDDDAGEAGWRVRMQLELPALGALDLRLLLRGEQLDVSFSADREDTRAVLDAQLPRLADALGSRGLSLGQSQSSVMPRPQSGKDRPDDTGPGLDVTA